MSFISGLGRPDYPAPVIRSTSQSAEADYLSLTDSTVAPTAVGSSPSASAQSDAANQQEQDREEAFAKMMVALQNPANQIVTPVSTDSSDKAAKTAAISGLGTSANESDISSTKSPEDEFKEYMALTPGEKMRYAAMTSLGVTPASLKAMSSEDRAAMEAKISDIVKKQSELQANATASASSTATPIAAATSGTSTSADDKSQSFLSQAFTQLTQSANDAKTKLQLV